MKKILLIAILAVASTLTNWSAYAQQTPSVEESVKQIAEEFDGVEGVDCMVLSKGLKLKIVKEAFKPMFGKEFMRDVKFMVIIDYTGASEAVRESFRSKIEAFSGRLQDFNPDKKVFKEDEYVRSYATINGESSISDFMIISEDKKSAMFLYMGGVLNVEELKIKK